MTTAALRLWLKVADPTALTARETLQRALGYGRLLRNVGRSEIWAFRWEEAVEARTILSRLARETNLFANPNKHHLEIAEGREALSPPGNAWVLTWREGEGRRREETLRRHRLLGSAPEIRRGVLWELDVDLPEPERLATVEEIAVTRERKRGLLANPHMERAVVLAAPPEAEAVAAMLFSAR